jgi:hypothetical protein
MDELAKYFTKVADKRDKVINYLIDKMQKAETNLIEN